MKKLLLIVLTLAVMSIFALNLTYAQTNEELTINGALPEIVLVKSVNSTIIYSGETVQYTFNVTNIGDVTLYNVTVVDDTFDFILNPVIGPLTLAPGESEIQLVNATIAGAPGTLTNTATANGTTLDGITIFGIDKVSVNILSYIPAIKLEKSVNATSIYSGDTVQYTFNVTNIGDATLSGVTVVDDTFDFILNPVIGPLTLAPGESEIQLVNATIAGGPGTLTNTATANGTYSGTTVTDIDSVIVNIIPFIPKPSLTITKTGTPQIQAAPGTITWNITITNTGNVPLTGVNVTDSKHGYLGSFGSLAPGKGGFFTIVEHDLISGKYTDQAFASGYYAPENLTVIAFSDLIECVVTPPNASLTVTKTGTPETQIAPGTITWNITITNTGDVTLTGVNVTDSKHGYLGSFGSMAPNATGFFTIAEHDLPPGTYTDQAFAAGWYAPENLTVIAFSDLVVCNVTAHPELTVTKTGTPESQLAPGTIVWNVSITNTGDVPLTGVNVTDSRHGYLGSFGSLAPGKGGFFTIVEHDLPPGTYYDNATAYGAFLNITVSDWDGATCKIDPVYVKKEFTDVGVLPEGLAAGFDASIVDSTHATITGLKSGPYVYFNVTYYFENSLNFLGDEFDGQAHDFSLWDKWAGNLLTLGSTPVDFSFSGKDSILTLADGSSFKINPRLTGSGTYRDYIGTGSDISNLASQGDALIKMHIGDQQGGTNRGKGKGTTKDGKSYDTDVVWYIGELGVNENATLTLIIAPGMNPGGNLEFGNKGCKIINSGPKVSAYNESYKRDNFLYAVDSDKTLSVWVKPK